MGRGKRLEISLADAKRGEAEGKCPLKRSREPEPYVGLGLVAVTGDKIDD
jgi:hypothetical protein